MIIRIKEIAKFNSLNLEIQYFRFITLKNEKYITKYSVIFISNLYFNLNLNKIYI